MTSRLHPLAATPPMEAKLVDGLPDEPGWQFEPKWDGFRAVASRAGDEVAILSKSGKSLGRYFPEILNLLRATRSDRYVIDGELILPIGDRLSFDALQARLHPAANRIAKLSVETPAQFLAFDCLAWGEDSYIDQAFVERRAAIARFVEDEGSDALLLSPATDDAARALGWLARSGGALDGIVAKRLDDAYRAGERAMLKVKQHRSADCVVGGFRRAKDSPLVASLLLGLYDVEGRLNHVGFTSAIAREDKVALTKRLEALIAAPGFDGKAPGGPSRWSSGRDSSWEPLKPKLVVEVLYDQVTADRFRHGTRLLRWRPDKAPRQCTMEQLVHELRPSEVAQLLE